MGNFYMEATQINYRRDDKLKTVDQKLQELSETSAIDTDIAPVFKSTSTYQPGDMVYYRNKLYVFNVEHTGAWAAADVTATDVTTELSSLKSGLTNVQADVKLNTQDLTTVSRSKNIVPMTLDNLKAQNTLGTWTGNAYEYNGIVWTINTNSAGQVTSITGNGTASGMSLIELWAPYKAGSYILTGAPADTPASGSYYLQFYANHVVDVKERGSGVTATLASDATVVVRPIVPDTVQLTNVTFYPMVRLSTESDPTFAPYIPSVESRIEAVESGLVYSSSETDTGGTWINGSKIYRKVIDISSNPIALSAGNWVTVASITGTLVNATVIGDSGIILQHIEIRISSGSLQVKEVDTQSSRSVYYVIAEYIKS